MTAGRLVRLLPNPRTGRGKAAIVAFLVTFGLLASTTAGFAYWSANDSVTSTVGAADLTLTTTNFSSVAYTFGNDSLVTTGSVTATNSTVSSSTQAGTVTLTFGPNAASTLGGLVRLTLWPTTAPANCTATAPVGTGSTTALWSASTVINTTLAPAASVSFCVRSSIASRESVATAGGTMSFSPKISGTIKLGTFTGSAVATVSQATQYIYPAGSPDLSRWWFMRAVKGYSFFSRCLDTNGGTTTTSPVITTTCSQNAANTNENWKIIPSGVTGYMTLQPRNATGLRLDNGGSTSSGSGLTLVTAGNSTTTTSQLWQLQLISANLYQLVNALSGMCVTSVLEGWDRGGQAVQQSCDGGGQQQFYFAQSLENLTCSISGGNVVWSWTQTATGPYTVYFDQTGGTAGFGGTAVATTDSATAAGMTAAISAIPPFPTTGTNWTNWRIFDGNAVELAVGRFTLGSPNTCQVY